MRIPALVLALLVAAALAGCTGGTSQTSQLPGVPGSSSTHTSAGNTTGDSTVTHDSHGPQNATFDAFLNVSTGNGTAPLNLTLSFDASSHDPAETEALDWTLEVAWTAGNQSGSVNEGSSGPSGNGTGNVTGNGTSSSSSSSPSPTGGNSTGTSGSTKTTSPAMANGTVVHRFEGTGAQLPGNRSVWLNETGQYNVTFTVASGNDTTVVREAFVNVTALPPGSFLGNETRTFDGSFLVSAAVPCLASDEFDWALNATHDGTPATVDHLWATVDAGGLQDITLTLVAPNGTEIASGPELNETGPFEAGTYVLRVESCVAADADYTVTAIARYVSA